MPPVTEIALVVGPIEPATKRGRRGVLAASAAARAIEPARRFISRACSASPYSASTTEAAPKVLVSIISAPASRKLSCSSRILSGRVRTKFSLQPSSCGPPKSAALRCMFWIEVPAAPSIMTIRPAIRSRKSPIRSKVPLMLRKRGPCGLGPSAYPSDARGAISAGGCAGFCIWAATAVTDRTAGAVRRTGCQTTGRGPPGTLACRAGSLMLDAALLQARTNFQPRRDNDDPGLAFSIGCDTRRVAVAGRHRRRALLPAAVRRRRRPGHAGLLPHAAQLSARGVGGADRPVGYRKNCRAGAPRGAPQGHLRPRVGPAGRRSGRAHDVALDVDAVSGDQRH